MNTPLRFASLALVVACLVAVVIWHGRPATVQTLNISASQESDLGMPVYAQFIATQSIHMKDTALISKLVVPMYLQEDSPSLTVRLIRNQHVLQEWQTPTNTSGVVSSEFHLSTPQLLDGTIEVQFDGQAISHAQKEAAPRVFVEPFDDAFPNGNYRIAQNEKRGDISLALFEQKTKGQLFWEGLGDKPLPHIARLCVLLAALILIASAPYAMAGKVARTRFDTNQQTF